MKFFSRALASGLTAVAVILGIMFSGSAAQATVTPSSGPVAGGTSVTVTGIHFVQVAAGDKFTLGLTNEGTVYAWGDNTEGELGNGTTTSSLTPVQVKGVSGAGFLTGVTSIAAGYKHSMAVTASGLFAWGFNSNGQLGDGSTTTRLTPVQVKGPQGVGFLTEVTSVSGGYFHSIAATSSGLYSWGSNSDGQLGDGTTVDSWTPTLIALSGVTSVAAGGYHSLAVTSGDLYSWGTNFYGQLGVGTNTDSLTPILVPLSGVTSVAAGGWSSFAVTASGLFAWGDNEHGQLGDGTTGNRNAPAHIALDGVLSVSTFFQNSAALTTSGVYTWGWNRFGQLGNGTTRDSSLPLQVPLEHVTGISVGTYRTMAMTPSGVYGWGYNDFGEIGDGTITEQWTPVLGANFQPGSVYFGSTAGTGVASSGQLWSATSPAGHAGLSSIAAVANVFGGTTAASPATVSWNAGTFTYEAALANTGPPNMLPFGVASVGALLLGAGLLFGLRRQLKK
jgi:hypothetical protein